MKTADVKKSLSNELVRIEEEMYLYSQIGKGTSTFRRQKTVESNNRLPLWKDKRPLFNNNFLAFNEESPNLRCRSAAKVNDSWSSQKLLIHIKIKSSMLSDIAWTCTVWTFFLRFEIDLGATAHFDAIFDASTWRKFRVNQETAFSCKDWGPGFGKPFVGCLSEK